MQIKKKILIVDDDKLISGAMKKMLENSGYVVSCCYNGMDALEDSEERNYDVILTDYYMPGMNGDEVCRQIRHRNPDVYIIGCSSDAERNQDFLNAGANVFLLKEELVQNLAHLIDSCSAQRVD
jgi:CheY-like chemotaxis protein